MTHFAAILVAIALQGVPANPPAQNQPPARSSIEGMVVRAGANEPVSRAQVNAHPFRP